MEVYIYAADLYCKDCGEAIRREITEEGHAPSDPHKEWSFDSDEFPKGPYPDGGGESDSPNHCGNHEKCCNAIVLSDGTKIGAWLENGLTADGVKYVREAIADGGEVAELWSEFYEDCDFS